MELRNVAMSQQPCRLWLRAAVVRENIEPMTRRTLVVVGVAAGTLVQGCSCGGGDCSVVVPLDGGARAGASRGLPLEPGACDVLWAGTAAPGGGCSDESVTSARRMLQCLGGRAPSGLQTLAAHARCSKSLDATLRTGRRRLSEAREEAMRRTLALPNPDASRALVDTLLC